MKTTIFKKSMSLVLAMMVTSAYMAPISAISEISSVLAPASAEASYHYGYYGRHHRHHHWSKGDTGILVGIAGLIGLAAHNRHKQQKEAIRVALPYEDQKQVISSKFNDSTYSVFCRLEELETGSYSYQYDESKTAKAIKKICKKLPQEYEFVRNDEVQKIAYFNKLEYNGF